LQEKNQKLEREQAEKLKLEEMLNEMNSKLVEGGEKLKKEEEERLAQTRKI
jgi:hypothetical protein